MSQCEVTINSLLTKKIDLLIDPLAKLFSMVYRDCTIPGQWLVAKITPILKMGSVHSIENYRPVAALCSWSNIFERIIIKRIAALELLNDVELVGSQQHGFRKGKTTATAGLTLQSIIEYYNFICAFSTLINNEYFLYLVMRV